MPDLTPMTDAELAEIEGWMTIYDLRAGMLTEWRIIDRLLAEVRRLQAVVEPPEQIKAEASDRGVLTGSNFFIDRGPRRFGRSVDATLGEGKVPNA